MAGNATSPTVKSDRGLLSIFFGFIHAAAGYGKTTLMHQLSESLLAKGKKVCWLTLDDDDNDPIRLYQYLRLALLDLEPPHSISYGQIHKQHIIDLTQKVAEEDADTVLFIDEFEALTNPECLNIFLVVVPVLPENCHFGDCFKSQTQLEFHERISTRSFKVGPQSLS